MITWAYLAGFIDCDGWVSITPKYCLIGLTQSAQFKSEMLQISEFLRFNNISFSFVERPSVSMIRGKKNKSLMFDIRIKEQKSLLLICQKLVPFSLIKKQKILICYKWAIDRLEKRGELTTVQEKRKYWTKKDIKNLLNLHETRYSNNAIANKLKRSSDSIAHKLYRLGVVR